ncbi:hypothetical protein [Saccharopolyspora phatthalungensis]|uniref:Uncharacterized protein n=1 Tax=Saccharopolyspora phatthalungensis TaxID=664693 RepID=A0A840Q8C6_9PSEU|nr:hypothetical protein [Saccharopolyspora phatthalungensis]MBB5154948.1 hypothetical protein [Saccharopolyspora phatthalungensis]
MVALGTSVTSAYDPWAVQSRVGLTDARLALDSVLMPRPNLSYIDYRSGIMASGDTAGVGGSSHMAMRVKPATSGLAVTVEMGNAVINTPGLGAYMCALDSVKTLSLAASSSTTNRIDLIIARVYDDLNPAIASASGVRKFAVEVWQGDPSTNTPAEPVPTPTSGWHPLAAVKVNKNATAITTTDITDKRGPGLVARGGMRSLFGPDALPGSSAYSEAGAYPGDQRWVHASGFQHQVYYGSPQGWRGVHNCMVYTANPPLGQMLWTLGAGNLKSVCSVTIPDPGTPYMIYPTARLVTQQSPGTAVDVHTKVDDPITGSAVNWVGDDTGNVNADTRHVYSVPPIMYGELTGQHTVYLTAQVIATTTGGGFGYRGNDVGHNLLSVCVYPSTVQPPAV